MSHDSSLLIAADEQTCKSNPRHLAPIKLTFSCPSHGENNEIEVSVHSPSKFFIRELQHVFQSTALDNVLAIPTMQRARMDLVSIGDDVETEKDRLLETVYHLLHCQQVPNNEVVPLMPE